jgi:uncharacterized protein YggE
MKHQATLAAAVALACGLSAAPAPAQIVPPAAISVTGEGRVSVPPDLAEIEGGVTSEAKTAREASDANNAAMGKVLLALKGAGLAEKDFQTSRLSLQPQYANQTRPGPNVVVGYRASNRVSIRLRDVSKVAGIIDTLVGAGANEIGGINFTVSEASKLLDDARTEAMAPSQGRDLCQGRRRHAGRADQYFRGRRRSIPDAIPQDVRRHGRRCPRRAGRRDAAGFGECVLGDQAGAVAPRCPRPPRAAH